MTEESIVRDERTVAVEMASYRWAYLVLAYGLLIITAYRSLVRHEAPWDLLILVIAGGAIANVYQGVQRVLSRRWAMVSAVAIVIALILAATLVFLRRPAL